MKFFRKPYPAPLNRWGIILTISPFISVFILIFQPFGLSQFQSEYKTILLAGYGLVTFVMLFINLIAAPAILPVVFREENWTVQKEILLLLVIVLTIAVGNFFYSLGFSIIHWHGFTGFVIFCLFTLAIAIFPILGVIIISHNLLLKRNLNASGQMNRAIQDRRAKGPLREMEMKLTSDTGAQEVSILPINLVCVESERNYTNILYINEGSIIKAVLRNTLKNIEGQLGNEDKLFRCHRAFIVNLVHIKEVLGNSQGYRLRMRYINREIPVSRNYTRALRKAMIQPG